MTRRLSMLLLLATTLLLPACSIDADVTAPAGGHPPVRMDFMPSNGHEVSNQHPPDMQTGRVTRYAMAAS